VGACDAGRNVERLNLGARHMTALVFPHVRPRQWDLDRYLYMSGLRPLVRPIADLPAGFSAQHLAFRNPTPLPMPAFAPVRATALVGDRRTSLLGPGTCGAVGVFERLTAVSVSHVRRILSRTLSV